MHLCYGDNEHQHFVEPESLWTQVRLANAVTEAAERRVNWFSFTVPQDKREPSFFSRSVSYEPHESRALLRAGALLPARQEPGTTDTRFASSTSTWAAPNGASAPSAAWPAPSGPTSHPA